MKKKNTRIRHRKYNSRKKFIFPLICLCILLGISVVGVFANVGDTFTDSTTGLEYKVLTEAVSKNDDGTWASTGTGTVTIVGYNPNAILDPGKPDAAIQDGTLTIPATVEHEINDYQGGSTAVIITYQVTEIGSNAFSSNESIQKISFAAGNKLTTIGENAFANCSKLGLIDFREAKELTKIDRRAFLECTSLTRVIMENAEKLTSIRKAAFMGCTNLNSVTLPASIRLISESAFENCVNLDKVVGSIASLEEIGKRAFYNCPWLMEIPKIPETASIAEGAFWGCCYISPDKFPEGSDPFDADTVLKYLKAELRGTSLTKIIPAEGTAPDDLNTSTPRRFFKGQEYEITFSPAGGYAIKGLDLLTPDESLPSTYSISSEFTPNTSGRTDYGFTIPADWKSDSFVIFAAATVDPAESGAPTLLTKELPPGLVNEPYQATLEASSESPIESWTVGWRYPHETRDDIREGLPAGLSLENTGSTVSKYISGTPTEKGDFIITVTAKNSVSSHTKSYDLHIYDKSLPSMTELKWKEANGEILTVWTPLQNTTAASINYVIRVYDEEGNLVGMDEKPLPGTETFESKFAELDVTKIIENAGKGVYTFTVTAESDGYARSFADSKSWPEKGYYAYGYENYTITATAEGTGYGKISLSSESYNIPGLVDKSITGGLEVKVREGVVTPDAPLSFIFTPEAGCEITSLTVDGTVITDGNLGSYTFNDLPESKEESTNYDREVIVEFNLVDNRIGGEIIEKTSYVQGEKAAFEAIGQNMDSVGEASEDTRWEPKFWSLDDSTTEHHWESEPYTDTIDTTNLAYGNHTLYVTFRQQRYVAGMGWQDVEGSHAVDTRSAAFTVTNKSGDVPDDPSGDDPSGDDPSGGGTSGGGTSGGGTSGGGGGIVDTITSYAAGVATGDNMALGMWSALALVSLCGIGFCIRQMFKFA